MLVNLDKKGLYLYKMPIREVISTWVEQDILVPDTKPDAMKIINVNVTPYVTDLDITDNKIKVNGKLNYYVIYKTNESNMGTRGLYVSLPYTQTLNIKGLKKNMDVEVIPKVKNVIYSLPNERKISVKVEVIFKVTAKDSSHVELIQNFDEGSYFQTRMKDERFSDIIKNKTNIIASREDIMIPKENEDFYEILKLQTSVANTEYKESYNKIMVKGDIIIDIMYLADKQDTEIKKMKLETPFTGMIEMESINDRSKFKVDYIIKDFNIKPNMDTSQYKTMNVDYQILVNVTMYEDLDVRYVDDFYSEKSILEYDSREENFIKDESRQIKNIEIKEILNNVISEEYRLLDSDIDTNFITLKQVNDNVHVEGNVKISLTIQNLENLSLENKVVDILVSEEFALDDVKDDSVIILDLIVDKYSIMQNGNELDIRIKLNIDIKSENKINITIIDKIEEKEMSNSQFDSMNIYIVKPKDTLWSIAKRYKTSVAKLMETNDILDENKIELGQKILIIR